MIIINCNIYIVYMYICRVISGSMTVDDVIVVDAMLCLLYDVIVLDDDIGAYCD